MSAVTASEIELAEQGEDYYRRVLRAKLEPEHKGEYLVLDVATGEYELDEDECAAIRRARAKKPHTVFYILRVGFPPERI
ncbi:MAG: hypothetical protein FJ291_18680 [Planctomycetes bacterium]|nr:hypothetical protein [Planctomycetota bacterium]